MYVLAVSWNQLPEEIRCANTSATFKSRLKTHLFSCAFVEWALFSVQTDCTVFYIQSFSILNCFKLFFNSLFLLLWLLFLVVHLFLPHFSLPLKLLMERSLSSGRKIDMSLTFKSLRTWKSNNPKQTKLMLHSWRCVQELRGPVL